jgi:hypothetical protein
VTDPFVKIQELMHAWATHANESIQIEEAMCCICVRKSYWAKLKNMRAATTGRKYVAILKEALKLKYQWMAKYPVRRTLAGLRTIRAPGTWRKATEPWPRSWLLWQAKALRQPHLPKRRPSLGTPRTDQVCLALGQGRKWYPYTGSLPTSAAPWLQGRARTMLRVTATGYRP